MDRYSSSRGQYRDYDRPSMREDEEYRQRLRMDEGERGGSSGYRTMADRLDSGERQQETVSPLQVKIWVRLDINLYYCLVRVNSNTVQVANKRFGREFRL